MCFFFFSVIMCISVDLSIMNGEKTVDICCKQQKYGLYMGCMVTKGVLDPTTCGDLGMVKKPYLQNKIVLVVLDRSLFTSQQMW